MWAEEGPPDHDDLITTVCPDDVLIDSSPFGKPSEWERRSHFGMEGGCVRISRRLLRIDPAPPRWTDERAERGKGAAARQILTWNAFNGRSLERTHERHAFARQLAHLHVHPSARARPSVSAAALLNSARKSARTARPVARCLDRVAASPDSGDAAPHITQPRIRGSRCNRGTKSLSSLGLADSINPNGGRKKCLWKVERTPQLGFCTTVASLIALPPPPQVSFRTSLTINTLRRKSWPAGRDSFDDIR